MQDSLLHLLFELSQWLLTPVVVGMVAVCVWLVYLVGQTIREAAERFLKGRSWRKYVESVRQGDAAPQVWSRYATNHLHRWISLRSTSLQDLTIFLREAEVKAHRRLGHLQILVRTGPMLGLVGTLIPLGPALQGLSNSNIQQLGSHMNIAFTMTVLGILIGAVSYGLLVVYRNWFEQDLSELEMIQSIGSLSNPTCGDSVVEGVDDESKDAALAS